MITKDIEKDVFVAHFDILGIGAVLSNDSWHAWQTILELSEVQDTEELPILPEERAKIKERFFSDTILLTTHDDSDKQLSTILLRSLELFRCALRSSIPVRGGVAHGTWFETNDNSKYLFTGSALLKSYKLGESQQFLGISVCHKVFERFYKKKKGLFGLEGRQDAIIEHVVPIKGKKDKVKFVKRYILNWPAISQDELKRANCDDAKKFSQYFWTINGKGVLAKKAKKKYSNTVDMLFELDRAREKG